MQESTQIKEEEAHRTIELIKEELKSRKVFGAFRDVGLIDCYFQPHLDSLILKAMALDDGSDETFLTYDNIMENGSKKISANGDSVKLQANKIYRQLMRLGKQRLKLK